MAVKKKEEAGLPPILMASFLPLCKDLKAVRDKLEKLTAQAKVLKEQDEYLSDLLATHMAAEGLDSIKTIYGSATTGEKEYPNIKDFTKAFDWIVKYKRTDLLSKEISARAWREMRELGEDIPGVESFSKSTLSFRRAAKKKSK
jgi:hypothetical protein